MCIYVPRTEDIGVDLYSSSAQCDRNRMKFCLLCVVQAKIGDEEHTEPTVTGCREEDI